ncbi:MAG: hypothetical protein ACR2H1_07680 [Limisphaerales bacterium]
MLWLWMPITSAVFVLGLWILVAVIRRRDRDGVLKPGETVRFKKGI